MRGIKIVVVLLLFLPITYSMAKSSYPVNTISPALLTGANSVVRNAETLLNVSSAGKAEYHVHKVITVLNEAGARELDMFIYYNQFRKLTSFEASLYDKDGKFMNKRRIGDLRDYAMQDGFSLFSDARCKQLQTGGGIFPVTIDYSYVLELNGILDYPDWFPQQINQAVESCEFQLQMPPDINVNYRCSNMVPEPVADIRKSAKNTIYIWHLQDLNAVKVPSNSYQASYFLPSIDISPESFEISGYSGSWKSWKAFGSTMYQMWKKTRNVSDDLAKEAREIVKDAKTDREKAFLLYTFLQKEFRYVSIQIGIGGFVPFDAATVHHARYGDCKALSNYMCSLLNTVGVKAYPALVNAGENAHPIDTAFPSNYFNHAILYAELSDGPLWLECTSNAIPFGELGTFTENRYALVFDKDGGRIMKTPGSDGSVNTLIESGVIDVSNDLQAAVTEKIQLNGQFRPSAKPLLVLGNKEERTHYVFNNLKLMQPELYTITRVCDSLNQVSFEVAGHNEKIFDFKTGNKYFLPSTLIKSWYENITADSTQKVDLLLEFPSTKTERLLFKLPAGSTASLPGNCTLDNKLIRFSRKCEQQADNKVTIETELAIRNQVIKPEEVALLKESLQTVNKYLQQKLIVVPF